MTAHQTMKTGLPLAGLACLSARVPLGSSTAMLEHLGSLYSKPDLYPKKWTTYRTIWP
jgi:hypothetical protein